MCLIIVKPAGKTVLESDLRSAFIRNSDGWGIMGLVDGVPMYNKKAPVKGRTVTEEFSDFMNIFHTYYKDKECVIHFRMRTSGNIDDENCHPYPLADGTLMMHNGVFRNVDEYNKEKSDTWHVGEVIGTLIAESPGLLRKPKFLDMMKGFCGSGNKLVFLDTQGVMIVNESEGIYYEGCWYSNTYSWNYPYTNPYYGSWAAEDYKVPGGKYWKNNKTHSISASYKEGVDADGDVFSRRVFLPNGSHYDLPLPGESSKKASAENDGGTVDSAKITIDAAAEDSLVRERLAEIELEVITSNVGDETIAEAVCDLPQNLTEWACLDLHSIVEIAFTEPEMVAEALYDLINGTA